MSFLSFVCSHMNCPQPNRPVLCGLQSPKRFEEVFEEMICFMEQTDHWENTEIELSARGVRDLILYGDKTRPENVSSNTILIKKAFFFFLLFRLNI